jgi:formylmethanofuran dehydrogenase subunit E
MKDRKEMSFEEIVNFHGHLCPGLVLGYRMAQASLDFFNDVRATDEELVAIVENDACGVDALQCVTGCTFGKGNLIFRDYGKQVYTLFHRKTGRAVRISTSKKQNEKRNELGDDPESRKIFIEWLQNTATEDLLKIQAINIPAPKYARIRESTTCAICGEIVMESCARIKNGKISCIPCLNNDEE